MMSNDDYPVAIIQDRYAGSYSGGLWLAIAKAYDPEPDGRYRVMACLLDGPHGDDTDAMFFWENPPAWIGVGNTPDEALSALREKVISR